MPRALAGTLLAATLLSMLAQFSIAGSASATEGVSWTSVFEGKGWHWAVVLTTVGELVLLPLIVLLSFLPQPELLAAMANDGLIPSLFNAIGGNGAFVWGSNLSGVFMVLIAVFVPFSIIWDVISLGVLISFNITNTSLIMMRYGNGGTTKQPAVGRLLGAFWIGGGIGAYTLWKCMVVPMLDGRSPSADAWKITAMGIVTLGMAVVILCVIYFCFHEEQSATNSFRAPAVPFLPGLAIILNFFMMATIDWWSQLACLAYLAACLLPYIIFRGISMPARKEETSQVSTV